MEAWYTLPFAERFLFNKLLTGALRVGVSRGLVQQALAELSGVDIALIAQRMLGAWTPSPDFLAGLLSPDAQPGDTASPFPFFLASPLEQPADALGISASGCWNGNGTASACNSSAATAKSPCGREVRNVSMDVSRKSRRRAQALPGRCRNRR